MLLKSSNIMVERKQFIADFSGTNTSWKYRSGQVFFASVEATNNVFFLILGGGGFSVF